MAMVKGPRILFIDQSSQLGGAELSLADLAMPYKDSCHVLLLEPGPFASLLAERGIAWSALNANLRNYHKDSGLAAGFCHAGAALKLTGEIAATARHFDLIHANTAKAALIGVFAGILSRRPVIFHLRDIVSCDHFSAFNRWLLARVASRLATLTVVNSMATGAHLLAAGAPPDKIRVLYCGFDPARFVGRQDEAKLPERLALAGDIPVVGCFSRLSPWKGQDILLKAVARLRQRVLLLMVGDALFGEHAYVNQLEMLAAELKLSECVRFLGFQQNVPELMRACHVVVNPSVAPEPFGRVIVEAQLSGRPVIATDGGGAGEIIEDGISGWLVKRGDEQALASALNDCLANPSKAEQIAIAGQKSALNRFSLAAMHKAYADIVAECLDRAGALGKPKSPCVKLGTSPRSR